MKDEKNNEYPLKLLLLPIKRHRETNNRNSHSQMQFDKPGSSSRTSLTPCEYKALPSSLDDFQPWF